MKAKYKKLLKYIVLSFAGIGMLCVLIGAAGAGYLYWDAVRSLPDIKKITDYSPPLVTTVYADDGDVLGYFYKEKRFLKRLNEMPEHLPLAFLAAEDDSFYQHEGVDPTAIFRALIKNLQAGQVVQGGSTITQQVIKSMLLTPEKSYERKIKEAILAYRLERYLTKDEILTIYLNQIFFGNHAYGVESAARTYFGKHVMELTIAEAAMLGGLPKAPSAYNPFNNPEAARNRQMYVLGRMRDLNWIDEAAYEEAVNQEMDFKSMPDPSWGTGAYYLEEVRRRLIDRFGEEMVYTKGLQVQTAMDFKHQIAAEKALRKGLLNSAKRRGWTGPAGNLKATDVQAFLSDQQLTFDDLEEKDMFQAVVTAVQEKEARVRFGSFEGRIDVKDVGWCRTPDPSKAHEEVRDIADVRKVLNIGDVVWVSVKDDTEAIRKVAEIEWEKIKSTVGNATMAGEMPMPGREHLWQLALEREPDVEGAIVSMDPVEGKVVAMVGGYDFKKSQFNRATQARRQPGSAFKPIVYSAALDNGLTPASIIQDAPIVYNDLENNRLWKPENFEGVFYGPTLLRTALVKSRNLVTIRVADRIGIGTIIERAKAMGLESEFPRDLSVSLGSSPVTLINLVQAYSVFARGGSYIEPRMVLDVKGPWGEDLYTSEPVAVDAVSPQTAYLMVSLMKEVVRNGTGWRAKVLKRPVAGKTGTSNDEQDAWFMGYTPYLLTGVYVGFDKMTPMGKWETGSRAASPIWVDYRKVVEEDYPAQDFPQPPGIVMVRIDAADGLPAGPGTKESYFLPFKSGTQPRATADRSRPGSSRQAKDFGEDLLKQIF